MTIDDKKEGSRSEPSFLLLFTTKNVLLNQKFIFVIKITREEKMFLTITKLSNLRDFFEDALNEGLSYPSIILKSENPVLSEACWVLKLLMAVAKIKNKRFIFFHKIPFKEIPDKEFKEGGVCLNPRLNGDSKIIFNKLNEFGLPISVRWKYAGLTGQELKIYLVFDLEKFEEQIREGE